MRCPKCEHQETSVMDSRPVEAGNAIRRRRLCGKCEFRFSTYEEMEILDLSVIKRNGVSQPYTRDKLERGIRRAFEKRADSNQLVKKIISGVEQEIQKKARDSTIASQDIGEIVMQQIKVVDKVAYIRFACVYRQFEDVAVFKKELQRLG